MNDQNTQPHWHLDAGHGWLQVPLATCEGLDISTYSYQDEKWAYLEEDCDAPLWAKAHGFPPGQGRVWAVTMHNGDCHIRRKARYKQS